MVTEAPGLRRSWGLLKAFRVEQADPDRFYFRLADDAARQVRRFTSVQGRPPSASGSQA